MLDSRFLATLTIGLFAAAIIWILSEAAAHDNAWQRDRDACLRAGGIPVHRHMPDGSMAQCASPLED